MKRNTIIVFMILSVIVSFAYRNIRLKSENYQIAYEYFKEINLSDKEIENYIDAIDLLKNVSVYEAKKGQIFVQYNLPHHQGEFYTLLGVPCDKLGISCEGREYTTYMLNEDISMLKGTADDACDTWTEPGEEILVNGGGVQFYSNCKECFYKFDMISHFHEEYIKYVDYGKPIVSN